MSSLEKADGSLASGKGSIARFLGQIVSAASVLPSGSMHASPVRCRRRPKRRPCAGHIELGRFESDGANEVRYRCAVCGDKGVIDNWRDTRWDLGPEMKRGDVISLSLARARRDAAPRTRVLTLACDLIDGPIALDGPVLRRVRIGSDHSLHQLHLLLCEAYERDADEPYEFMFGAPYEIDARRFTGIGDADVEEGEPLCETHQVRVHELGLEKNQVFGYLYDFDAEWVHRLTVVDAREDKSCATVVERVGQAPDVYAEGDGEWIETLVWGEDEDDLLDGDVSDCPMSELYGPYVADSQPDPDWWLAMEDLERLLLVLEAHSGELPTSHPPATSLLLHSVVHEMAETQLANGDDKLQGRLDKLVGDGLSRHEAIHALGRELLRDQL
ncbi:MAG: hypothetical protein KC503_19875 [Myxococcales bacterium]|nr:hypothetical protein [Myxococcales bacterium]